jgi:hypothetical protein
MSDDEIYCADFLTERDTAFLLELDKGPATKHGKPAIRREDGNPYRPSAPVELTYYEKRKRPWYRPRWSLKLMLGVMLCAALCAGTCRVTWPWLMTLEFWGALEVFTISTVAAAALVLLFVAIRLYKRRVRCDARVPGSR